VRSRVLLLFTVFALLVATGAVYRSTTDPTSDGVTSTAVAAQGEVPGDEPVAQVAAEVEPSVVQVNVSGVRETPYGAQEQEGLGSGVIYREDGYIVTNNHVVEGADTVEVAFADGTTEEGEVVGTDPTTDLAVIQVNRDGLPAASFDDGRGLVAGQLAVAIGSPSGFQSTVTSGVLSAVGREFPAELTGGRQDSSLVDLLQTDAPISPGNSGGALADRNGNVIGINVAYLPPQQTGAEGIGFAIPSYTVVSVADQLIESGEAQHPYLGVSVSDLTPEVADRFGASAESGALIADVEPGGPADAAGVEAGDVVTALGSVEVRSSGDLLSALRQYEPGETVEMTVLRGGEESRLDVRLGER
jgi:S1-C subfamily serine protease